MFDAAKVFQSKFGSSAKFIWGIGLLASGLSSVLMILITGPYIMEGFMKFNLN
jgi:Mn2+/Fe2+ NRAMP family transporter